ncbi:MAG: iron-containing alcohol dehydrogenase [Bacilli bacterium]|jgi:alcohol dehydrogenase YqhD (iron-dependent ADH family)
MRDFTYFNPTAIFFGRNQEKNIGKIVKEYGFSKIIVHYGQGSVVRSGLLKTVRSALKEEGINFIEIGGVQPNPDISLIREVMPRLKKEKYDLVLALGGGSAIDSAKLIANGYYYHGDPFDFSLRKAKPERALPVGVILTISSAGSEMSTSCVISDESKNLKIGFNSPTNRPLFVIENPELTYSVPALHTSAGIVDMMMHTLERYFNYSEELEISDEIALGVLRTIVVAGKKVLEDPTDYLARANLMLASTLSHNGLTSLGKTSTMPVHQLEHALGGLYPQVIHGVGLAILFPYWAKQYVELDHHKFARLGREVFGVEEEDEHKAAHLALSSLQKYFIELGMPISLKELEISQESIPFIVDHLFSARDVIRNHLKPLNRELAHRIFLNAFEGENL